MILQPQLLCAQITANLCGVVFEVKPSRLPDVNLYNLTALMPNEKRKQSKHHTFRPLYSEVINDQIWVPWPDIVQYLRTKKTYVRNEALQTALLQQSPFLPYAQMCCYLSILPLEVVNLIFGLLTRNASFKELAIAFQVCKDWQRFLTGFMGTIDIVKVIGEQRTELVALPLNKQGGNYMLTEAQLYQLTLLNARRNNSWVDVMHYPIAHKNVIATGPNVPQAFPTCYANVGFYPGFKLYYEVVVLQPNLMQIGLISPLCEPMIRGKLLGVGDDDYSWAMDGHRQKLWGTSSLGSAPQSHLMSQWGAGDIVGVCVDLTQRTAFNKREKGTITFLLNNVVFGAFTLDIIMMKEEGMFPLLPAVSLQYANTSVRFVFDSQHMRYDKSDQLSSYCTIANAKDIEYRICEIKK